MSNKIIYLASDHRGCALKQTFIRWLTYNGYEAHDLGPDDDGERVNASDYAVKVATVMREHPEALGVLICGTGQVMAMTSNRYQHIRAALCTNSTMARLAREHNNANILVLGAHVSGEEVAMDCLRTFLSTESLGGRYAERCDMLTALGGL